MKHALVGFPYAFQIWACEVIPLLGMKYASRIGRSFPRILNWTSIATPKYTEIQSLFVESNVSNILIFVYTFFFIYISILLLLTTFFLLWIISYLCIPYSFGHRKSMNKSMWNVLNSRLNQMMPSKMMWMIGRKMKIMKKSRPIPLLRQQQWNVEKNVIVLNYLHSR